MVRDRAKQWTPLIPSGSPGSEAGTCGDSARGHDCSFLTLLVVETHVDFQHDAQLDHYGKRLATASSDKTIRIFNVVKGEAKGDPVILKG